MSQDQSNIYDFATGQLRTTPAKRGAPKPAPVGSDLAEITAMFHAMGPYDQKTLLGLVQWYASWPGSRCRVDR